MIPGDQPMDKKPCDSPIADGDDNVQRSGDKDVLHCNGSSQQLTGKGPRPASDHEEAEIDEHTRALEEIATYLEKAAQIIRSQLLPHRNPIWTKRICKSRAFLEVRQFVKDYEWHVKNECDHDATWGVGKGTEDESAEGGA